MNNNDLNHIEQKPLHYQSDLAQSLFDNIEHLPWSMLLSSPCSTHVDSRFDILVAKPMATIITLNEVSTVDIQGTTTESTQDPFTLLSEIQQRCLPDLDLPSINSEQDLPFVGGALGYFAYDLGRRVESLPSLAVNDLSAPDMAVGVYSWAIIVDHKKRSACVVGVDVEKHWQWLTSQEQVQVQQKAQASRATFKLTSSWQSNMDKASYTEKFNTIQNYLLSGDCYQINLAQRFSANYSGSEWQAYRHLENHNQAPFSAFIRLESCSILSVSPERFLQVKGSLIETKPIKGTRPRSKDAAKDQAYATELLNAEKDQAENLMIVDLLRNDIGRVAKPGSVHVPTLFDIESFPAVHHLVSTIRAQLDEQYSAVDLLRASFPGGSITGAPKVRAMQIIEELEPHRRKAYCGSIGYISRHGHMDTSITIRTLVAETSRTGDKRLFAWAGGGIVADSDADSEYQETLDKLSRILPVLETINSIS